MVLHVTRRDRLRRFQGRHPRVLQEVDVPAFETVVEGRIEDLALAETINRQFEEGDLGEVQFFLREELDNGDRGDVEKAMEELERQLIEGGALPWPGATRIAHLDWPNRTVRLLFMQGVAFLLVLVPTIIRIALIVASLPLLVDVLKLVGIPIPESVESIADALGLIGLIAASIFILRRLGLPLGLLIPGGLLIFALLAPETAFRVLKWSRDLIKEALGIDLLLVGLGAALAAGGAFIATRGGTGAVVAGVAGLGAGGFLAFQGLNLDIGQFDIPDSPPRPGQAAFEVIGNPTFSVQQIEV